MMQKILEARNINKYFYEPEKFQVLKNLNFDIYKGEFLSIVGKSGCGKSTLLYVLSTMDTDYQGSLKMLDVELTNKSQNELSQFRNEHIGFVFQFHFLLPEFTVLQNVMIPALKLGRYTKEEVERRALAKLDLLGLKDQSHKRANKLSGGQQQRVAIARALINDPSIIMGDEPTGNLDKNNSNLVFDILREISSSQKQTIITVTHDLDFAKNCDRVITMEDGEIIKQ